MALHLSKIVFCNNSPLASSCYVLGVESLIYRTTKTSKLTSVFFFQSLFDNAEAFKRLPPQSGQTHLKNSSATADEVFECV